MRTIGLFMVLAALVLLSACTAITNPSGFVFQDGCPAAEPSDLQLVFANMDEFGDERIEFRVVDVEDVSNITLITRGVLEGIGPGVSATDGTDGLLCLTIPDLAEDYDMLAVQVYIDDNGNEIFEPDVGEESWSEEALDGLVAIDGTADSVVFDEPVDSQGDAPFRLSVTGMSPHVFDITDDPARQQHIEFMLFDDTDSVVGYHRFPFITSSEVVIDIPGVVESGRTYRAQFYADANRDGEYTVPPGDHAWCLPSQVEGGEMPDLDLTAGDGGIDTAWAHNGRFEDLDSCGN